MYSADLKNWFYAVSGKWKSDDHTIEFVPLLPSSCILQPSIQISSSGLAATTWPDYFGTFYIVPGKFSVGRPVWRNRKGNELKIKQGRTYFAVYDDLKTTAVRSGSGPTCPIDTKAGKNAQLGHGWQFKVKGEWVEDGKIVAN